MQDWFRFGAKLGRFAILRARRHGARVQRYDAHDTATKKPVIITCAKPERPGWKGEFEKQAKRRASLEYGPALLDWGSTDQGVFYLVEEKRNTEALSTYPWGFAAGYVLFYALADALADFAADGWLHGALDPEETLGRIDKEPVVYGAGFLHILGCAEGVALLGSKYAAPEMEAGSPWNEKADVFSLCGIITDLSRADLCAEDYYSVLGVAASPLQAALLPLEDRPLWADLLPVVDISMRHFVECIMHAMPTQSARTSGRIPRLREIADELAILAPKTKPASSAKRRRSSSQKSEPTPPPAPRGRPAAEALGPEAPKAEALGPEAPKAERGEKLAATLESIELDRITLPSPPFASAPSNQQRAAKWIGAGLGLIAGVAACFALLWSARVPALAPLEQVQSAPAFEAPLVLWTIATAEGLRSTEPEQPAPAPHRMGSRPRSERGISRGCRLVHCSLKDDQE